MWWCLSDAVASLMPLHHEATQHCHPWGEGGGVTSGLYHRPSWGRAQTLYKKGVAYFSLRHFLTAKRTTFLQRTIPGPKVYWIQ